MASVFALAAGRLFPALLALLFTVGLFAVALRHEMWRDEVQAWLISRDSPDLVSLMTNMKYEGHTALWHVILWMISRFTADPLWMQVAHVIIAGLSAFLLFRFAPFPAPVRILIPFGYFLFYEWGVVSRNYGISALLLFTVCVFYRDRWKYFPILGALVFLLCHTNIYGIIIGAVLFIMWMIEFTVSFVGKYRDADKFMLRVLAGFLLIVAGLISSIRQINPPRDSEFANEWHTYCREDLFRSTSAAVFNAFLPLPVDGIHFWSDTRFLKEDAAVRGPFPYIPPEKRVSIALWILGISCLFFFKRPWLIVPLCMGYLGILAFMYLKYHGGLRHHGFLYLHFIVMLWMSHEYAPWRLPFKLIDWPFAFLDRYRLYALVPLFLLHIAGMWTAVLVDWNGLFTNATEAARWLNTRYPDRTGIVFVGDRSPEASAVAGNMKLDRIYYTDKGDFGSYVIWNNRRRYGGEHNLGRAVRRLLSDGVEHLVMILDYRLKGRNLPDGVVFLQSFNEPDVVGERYHIYELVKPAAATPLTTTP